MVMMLTERCEKAHADLHHDQITRHSDVVAAHQYNNDGQPQPSQSLCLHLQAALVPSFSHELLLWFL